MDSGKHKSGSGLQEQRAMNALRLCGDGSTDLPNEGRRPELLSKTEVCKSKTNQAKSVTNKK
jgi:hypothetical protein